MRCMCSRTRKMAGPVLGFVAAETFEDGRAVADHVGKDVNLRVFPADQFPVMPYFFSRLHAIGVLHAAIRSKI